MDQARSRVNNAVYDTLDERWYDAQDDPVALLRAESAARTPWIESEIEKRFPLRATRVLDVGCGGGFLSNALATSGRAVTGIDSSQECLAVAARHDGTRSVRYVVADARQLPFDDGSFNVVCAMNFWSTSTSPRRPSPKQRACSSRGVSSSFIRSIETGSPGSS